MDRRVSDPNSYTHGGTSRRDAPSGLVALAAGSPRAAAWLAVPQNTSVLATPLAPPGAWLATAIAGGYGKGRVSSGYWGSGVGEARRGVAWVWDRTVPAWEGRSLP